MFSQTMEDASQLGDASSPLPADGSVRLVQKKINNIVFDIPEQYDLHQLIGQGAYGQVVSAKDVANDEQVAIKKVLNVFGQDREYQKRILREIKILQHFDHDNIIRLKDLIPPRSYESFSDVYIVTELMNTDLRKVIRSDMIITDKHAQYILYQILVAVKAIHSANVLHRDLKPSNILINTDDCLLKVCDFGLSRGVNFQQQQESEDADNNQPPPDLIMSTTYVATRWYRSPELLMMWPNATKAMDMWSVGCIFAELLNRKPLFPGKNYLDQLKLILNVLGTPQDSEIRACEKAFRFIKQQPIIPKKPWKALFPNASDAALDLLEKLLKFDPMQRITAEQALEHPYLAAFHSPEHEPAADIFSWEFDANSDIKKVMYDSIMQWRQEMFDFEDDGEEGEFSQDTTMSIDM